MTGPVYDRLVAKPYAYQAQALSAFGDIWLRLSGERTASREHAHIWRPSPKMSGAYPRLTTPLSSTSPPQVEHVQGHPRLLSCSSTVRASAAERNIRSSFVTTITSPGLTVATSRRSARPIEPDTPASMNASVGVVFPALHQTVAGEAFALRYRTWLTTPTCRVGSRRLSGAPIRPILTFSRVTSAKCERGGTRLDAGLADLPFLSVNEVTDDPDRPPLPSGLPRCDGHPGLDLEGCCRTGRRSTDKSRYWPSSRGLAPGAGMPSAGIGTCRRFLGQVLVWCRVHARSAARNDPGSNVVRRA